MDAKEAVGKAIDNFEQKHTARKEARQNTTFYYSDNAVGNAEKDVYYEHAHWKYVYDHSRIKPHVDKVLAAVKGKCTKKAKKKNAKRKG